MDNIKSILTLLTNKVISNSLSFEVIPNKLKSGVYEMLRDTEKEHLAGDYEPPTTS